MLTNPQSDITQCVGGSASRAFGLELCGELSYPYDSSRSETPFFPFTGPSKARIYLNKRETYTGFHFEAKYLQQKVSSCAHMQLLNCKIQKHLDYCLEQTFETVMMCSRSALTLE